MSDQVKKYIEAQRSIIERDKEKRLIEFGVTEKEYAPDNQRSYTYDMCEEVDGETKYYRIVAAKVTDEEYAEILENDRQIDLIFAREKEKEASLNAPGEEEKKWVPVYELPSGEDKDTERGYKKGKSSCATTLRVLAWIIFIVVSIVGLITGVDADEGWITFVCIGSGLLNMLFFYALAEILDRLAELTAIARNGIKYKVDKK